MKKVLGWVAVVLGAVGTIACVAGLVGLWVVHAKIQGPLGELIDTLTDLGTRVEERAGDVAAGVQTARGTVGELDERVAGRAQDLLALPDEDLERMADGYARVRVGVQRVRDLVDLAGSAMDFLDHTVGMVEASVGFVQTEREARASLRTVLAEGRREMEEASRLLDEAAARLSELRSGGAPAMGTGPLRSLAERVETSLGNLQNHVETFAAGIGELRDGIEELHRRIRRVLVLAAAVFSLLLLWQLAAQLSLAFHGWGWARENRA